MVSNLFLLPKEAAPILGCSAVHVRRLIRNGKLRAHKVGYEYRLTKEDVEAFRASVTVNKDKGAA